MQKVIKDLNCESVKVGLKIYVLRTKVMLSSLAEEFSISSQPLKSMRKYVHI